jgi:hypothetical protein
MYMGAGREDLRYAVYCFDGWPGECGV